MKSDRNVYSCFGDMQQPRAPHVDIGVSFSGCIIDLRRCGRYNGTVSRRIGYFSLSWRKDPFFYRCDGGLCFDYIKEIESRIEE